MLISIRGIKKILDVLQTVSIFHPRGKWLSWQLLNIMHLVNSAGSIFDLSLSTVSISSRDM